MAIAKTISKLKQDDQDFEFYPTTNEIIDCIKTDIRKKFNKYGQDQKYSVLDCGAGDGRVLNALANGDIYAIEKSTHLLSLLSDDTFIVGTDFHESTLIDKKVDVLFCNPPYSEFQDWASKIITEANAVYVYLVIPNRWDSSVNINSAIKERGAIVNTLKSFDFLDADRQARAVVDVLRIDLTEYQRHLKKDPFDLWFEKTFKKPEVNAEEQTAEKIDVKLIHGKNLVNALVELYNNELDMLCKNFETITSLSPDLLNELSVNTASIKSALKQRIEGLKNKYWLEFFNNYDVINKKLTKKTREKMLEKLKKHVCVDFTVSNIYAITGWCIKNANSYFNSQLIETVENIVSESNVKLYKSNQRLFKKEDWRYSRYDFVRDVERYSLETRCILTNQGGLRSASYYSYDFENGLGKRAHTTINDLIVIANNLGIHCLYNTQTMTDWSEKNNQDVITSDGQILMNIKAFKNGNLHIKFNSKFIKKLNVEFGRLKGWLKNKSDVIEEMGLTENEAEACFCSNKQFKNQDGQRWLALNHD